MKPKTEREKLLVELADQLPPLTEKQLAYPKESIFKKKGFYWKKGLVWCQCCGKEYPLMRGMLSVALDVGGEVCPYCDNEIHLEPAGRGTSKHNNEMVWYSVISTFRGWQVARVFEAERSNTRGIDTRYYLREVYQIWVDDQGKETIVTKPYSRGPYHLSWQYASPYVIGRHNGGGGGYFIYPDLFDVTGYYFYPRVNVLPVIRRNGWQSKFIKLSNTNPIELMRALLTNSDIEMLAKTGQHAIMRYWMRNEWHKKHDREDDFFEAIKIANRNHYKVEDPVIWYDMLEAMAYLGIDTHNAHYVCPKDLMYTHDLYVRRMQKVKSLREREAKRKEAEQYEEAYMKQKGCYLGICFGNDNVTVSVLQSVIDFVDEGEAMHHCVYTNGYYSKKDCLILSARDKDKKRLATIELSLKTFKVQQCRAACNKKPDKYDEIVSLVESHAIDFRRAKRQLQTA